MEREPSGKGRSWPILVIGVLLLLQAAGLGAISVFNISLAGFPLGQWLAGDGFSPEHAEAVYVNVPLVALALLTAVAGGGFLLLRPFGWFAAMSLQGFTLYYCLHLYFFAQKPGFVYLIMPYSIVMVLYLNSSDVQFAFRSRPASSSRIESHER